MSVSRIDALIRINYHVRDLRFPALREQAIDQLAEELGIDPGIGSLRPLTEDEVRVLASGTTTIGAHTVSHPWLPKLPLPEVARELIDSKRYCEDLVGAAVSSFAYPFGAYDSNIRAAVIAAGYRFACSTVQSAVSAESDKFALPEFE